MFSKYCSDGYSVQKCKVFDPEGSYKFYPELNYRSEVVDVTKANGYVGIKYDNFINIINCLSYHKLMFIYVKCIASDYKLNYLIALCEVYQ